MAVKELLENMTDITSLDPDKEITCVSFEHEGAHLAICHKSQGFSANGKPDALLLKGDAEPTEEAKQLAEIIKAGEAEVRIETDMVTFLRKWYGMWYDDAETLAMILGYNKEEVEEEQQEYKDYLAGKVEGITLLKAGDSIPLKAKASEIQALQDFIKSNEALLKSSFSEGDSEVKKDGASHIPPQNINKQNGDNQVSTEVMTIEKANEMLARMEALEKANIEKDAKLAAFEKANQERIEKAFNKKVEGYSFITEEERPEVVKTLMSLDNKLVLDILDKAQAAVAAVTKVQGSEAPAPVEVEKSGVAALLMAQFPEIE